MQDETSLGNSLSHRARGWWQSGSILTEDGLEQRECLAPEAVLSRPPKPWACAAPVTKEVQTPETERKPSTSSHLEAGDTPRAWRPGRRTMPSPGRPRYGRHLENQAWWVLSLQASPANEHSTSSFSPSVSNISVTGTSSEEKHWNCGCPTVQGDCSSARPGPSLQDTCGLGWSRPRPGEPTFPGTQLPGSQTTNLCTCYFGLIRSLLSELNHNGFGQSRMLGQEGRVLFSRS